MHVRWILGIFFLVQATNAFSNSGTFYCAERFEPFVVLNALRQSQRRDASKAVPPETVAILSSLNVISSLSRSGEASIEALAVIGDQALRRFAQSSRRLAASLPSYSLVRDAIVSQLRKYWWLSPMMLAAVPLYCAIFKGTYAAMPEWWNVVNMDHIAAANNSHWIIGHFLGSNIAYFLSGAYLMLKRFPIIRQSKRGGLKFRMTTFSLLGAWITLAGTISTVFHSVQAVGPYALAQSLCYLDHAVAVSAFCYFVDTCGIPSKRVLWVGSASLVTLAVTTPGYTFLHSMWHYLSAATATLWALEGYSRLCQKSSKSK
jgi:hypothetical protein